MSIRVIILAAGKGTRMKSRLPKVLHPLAGRPLLGHVLDSAMALDPAGVTVVVGHQSDRVRAAFDGKLPAIVQWAEQREQLGTAHAVMQGLGGIEDDDTVLIVYGDIPLTRNDTFRSLLQQAGERRMALLTLDMDDPTGYGRIIRNTAGDVTGIVEHKDADDSQRAIREINSGIMAARGAHLRRLLPAIDNDNKQGEYYLPDLFSLAVADGIAIETSQPTDSWEVDGVNSREQLAVLERRHQSAVARELMAGGVSLADPGRLDVRGQLSTGTDVSIDVGCVFVGDCHIDDDVVIGAGCVISDSRIGAGSVIHPHSVIDNADIGKDCSIGPFARVRPGTRLADAVKVGNFVETKNVTMAAGSKVNHLSYIGDSEVGERVNIGAGTITCNYDGANKNTTIIGDDVFVGSNTALVAPLTIGRGATIGAGSTLGQDVAEGDLSVTRAERRDVPRWQRPTKR